MIKRLIDEGHLVPLFVIGVFLAGALFLLACGVVNV